ncbi:MAG: hypothetical protein P4M11_15040 [Candidatus Pacebacteria bacterium]|nr:hypothetical protein [Candidatus Paceibacterota bacterium]
MTSDTKKELSKALATIAMNTVIAFATEALPLQIALSDDFINLFSRSPADVDQDADLAAERQKTPINESAISAAERKNSVTIISIPNEETKGQKENGTPSGTQNAGQSSTPTVGQSPRKKRLLLKEYVRLNLSLDAIRKRIRGQVATLDQITLKQAFSPAIPEKLGRIFEAELAQPGVPTRTVAVRLVNLEKIPSYLLEGLYLELCYRLETAYDVMVPIMGIACESQKLYFIMPKYALSLSQYIYEKEVQESERRKIIKYVS